MSLWKIDTSIIRWRTSCRSSAFAGEGEAFLKPGGLMVA